MWDSLVAADPKWPGTIDLEIPQHRLRHRSIRTTEPTFRAPTRHDPQHARPERRTSSGNRKYPFPQAGRNSRRLAEDQAQQFHQRLAVERLHQLGEEPQQHHVQEALRLSHADGLLATESRGLATESEDLWRTPHYPFHAIKNGASLFLQFLDDLDFGDEVGLVGYGQWAVQQKTLNDGEVNIDISSDPITPNYSHDRRRCNVAIRPANTTAGRPWATASSRPASCWWASASDPNDEGYTRYGARPTMIVMTDGQTNQKPSGWSLPASFKWKDWTDYDGDGVANYTHQRQLQEVRLLGSDRGHQARHHDPHAGRGRRRRPRPDGGHRLCRRRRVHRRAGRQHGRRNGRATAARPSRRSPRRCRRRSCSTRD